MKKPTLTFRLGKLTPGHPCCICNVSSGKGVMVHDQGDPGDAYDFGYCSKCVAQLTKAAAKR